MTSNESGKPQLAIRLSPLPNILDTRIGRLTAFFLLYVTEGIPLGFSATAVATQMRRQDMTPEQIGIFVGTLYLPWAWKWMIGPFVDVFFSDRLGRRRAWIAGTQILMSLALLYSITVDYASQLSFYTTIIVIANVFGATNDVAIDALACQTLAPEERGTANGLMFSGAYLGQTLGGAGVLYLAKYTGFSGAGILAIAAILAVTVFVALPMREHYTPKSGEGARGDKLAQVGSEIKTYVTQAARSIFMTRNSILAAVFALIPCGAMSMSLALQSNLSVELGLTDDQIADLSLISTVVSAVGCVVGGWLSDKFGRRMMLSLYVVAMSIPVFVMCYWMHHYSYVMPVDMKMENRPPVEPYLVTVFWAVNIVFSVFQGLMYGTRTALLMDVCDPAVAATQFTAYMSMMNLVIWYSSTWQGMAITRYGYPATLLIDAITGMLCILILPFIRKREEIAPQ